MKNPYYALWADAFCRFKRHHRKDKDWVMKIFQMITFTNGINLATIVIWLRILDIWYMPVIDFDIFPGSLLDKVFVFFIVYWLPCIMIHYFFIIRKKKYNEIIEKYGEATQNYSLIYCIGSALFGFVTIMIYGFFDNYGF